MKSLIGKRYALAMFGTSSPEKRQVIKADFELIKNTLSASSELRSVLASPVVKPYKKKAIISALFGNKISDITLDLLSKMIAKNRANFILAMIKEFYNLLDEEAGIVNAYVKSTIPMTESNQEILAKKIQNFFGKQPRINVSEDKSLIGGFIVRVGDSIIDESITYKLSLIKKQLQASPN